MNGEIKVTSNVFRGSVFKLILPINARGAFFESLNSDALVSEDDGAGFPHNNWVNEVNLEINHIQRGGQEVIFNCPQPPL